MRALLLLLLLLAACGRPLTDNEIAFLSNVHGSTLDTSRIRIHDGLQVVERTVPVPPRLTCQNRLYPPIEGETFTGASTAMTIFENVFIRSDWFARDMAEGYPETVDLGRAMLLAHETVHAWQWQHRRTTGYHPLRAAFEHAASPDPYLFDPDTRAHFDSFGYEQQGAIVEEYLCCRLLAPEAERTARLHAMLAEVFPVTPLSTPIVEGVYLPWAGAEIDGICD